MNMIKNTFEVNIKLKQVVTEECMSNENEYYFHIL